MKNKPIFCPQCGKEFASGSNECERCGYVIKTYNISPIIERKIDSLDVDKDWRECFKLIEKYYMDGKISQQRPLVRTNPTEMQNDFRKIKNPTIFLLVFIFGPLYYLVKGMWLKALVYITIMVLTISFAGFNFISIATHFVLAAIYGTLAPFNYFRLKVLDEQW